MHPITKQRILRLIERAGYVVTKVADRDQREQFISELEAELARRAERVAQLEEVRAALARKLSETDCAFRLGRERDARELEAARTETWELRVLAAELRQQLDGVRHERSEHNDLLNQRG
jgi:hypothetical protein